MPEEGRGAMTEKKAEKSRPAQSAYEIERLRKKKAEKSPLQNAYLVLEAYLHGDTDDASLERALWDAYVYVRAMRGRAEQSYASLRQAGHRPEIVPLKEPK
jgi:hypothetical protein